ncbi:hypothetical protein FPSE_07110 [Fusarium pseudograminearum CS3096]|uniref:Uncharacterized protein n=1 Tax=Fusarium pseudograminearum (strain CS3096) TaxID=1028729 RepID=K3VZN5_FUSPC|nr:hypothetical protein FPSE_07110 [Fusarium pseudograminearum CS3096]EKJ72710.1 hypothetical protein FPSE_07110 [Fusarium pseudograminearum CS3096]
MWNDGATEKRTPPNRTVATAASRIKTFAIRQSPPSPRHQQHLQSSKASARTSHSARGNDWSTVNWQNMANPGTLWVKMEIEVSDKPDTTWYEQLSAYSLKQQYDSWSQWRKIMQNHKSILQKRLGTGRQAFVQLFAASKVRNVDR